MRPIILILVVLTLAMVARADETTTSHPPAHGTETQAAGGAHAGQEHHAPRTYLGIPAWIWKTVNMIVFLGLLIYLVKGPVGVMFRERGEAIKRDLAEAKTRREKSDQLAGDIQKRLSQIEVEVLSIRRRSEEEGKRQRQELIEAAEAEGQKILAAARGEVESRLRQARRELTEYAGELAAKRAEELLSKSLTQDDRKKIFSDSVRQLEENRG